MTLCPTSESSHSEKAGQGELYGIIQIIDQRIIVNIRSKSKGLRQSLHVSVTTVDLTTDSIRILSKLLIHCTMQYKMQFGFDSFIV